MAAFDFARCFPPIANPSASVLILGSMPGAASLAAAEYYAHPRNAFWAIMGELFGAGPDLPYPKRRQLLMGARVAVWDVLAECRREGSLDSSIETASEVANDFLWFFAKHRQIRRVYFNGQKAEAAFRRHVVPNLGSVMLGRLELARLPSTSPANAGKTGQEKLAAWRVILDALKRSSTGATCGAT